MTELKFDLAALICEIRKRPFIRFEYVEINPRPSEEQAYRLANRILEEGFTLGPNNITGIRPPIDWDNHERSFEFHLHAFLPIKRILVAYDYSKNIDYLNIVHEFAFDWICQNSPAIDLINIREIAAKALQDGHRSRWYDMAIGQRLQALAYIFDALARTELVGQDILEIYAKQIMFHHVLLEMDGVFQAHTNHGFFQAITQYCAARRLPELADNKYYEKLSRGRLLQMLERQFTCEAVHNEHSPGYHYMLCVTLANGVESGAFDADLVELFKGYEHILSYMAKPDFTIATIGDTDRRIFSNDIENPSFFSDADFQYVASMGAIGTMPKPEVKCFKESGYAFARLLPKGEADDFRNFSYLAQLAAFHSRTHKHADHLSFVWFDNKREILSDPGRFAYAGKTTFGSELFEEGFWYSDPKRIYCESTYSHNCVVIDGQNYQRKGNSPFGSALVDAREENGLAITECEVWHFKSIRHRRRLVMKPGHFLIVLDWLFDRSGAQHEYVQRFLFEENWHCTNDGKIVRASHNGGMSNAGFEISALKLCAGTAFGNAEILPLVRGQEEPALLGWISDKANSLIPTYSMGVRAMASGPHSFATIFTFGETLAIDQEKSRTNATQTSGSIVWQDDYGSHVLEFSPNEGLVRFSMEK